MMMVRDAFVSNDDDDDDDADGNENDYYDDEYDNDEDVSRQVGGRTQQDLSTLR